MPNNQPTLYDQAQQILTRDLIISTLNWNTETKRQSGSGITTGTQVSSTNKDFNVIGTAEQNWDAVRLHILNAETTNSVAGVTASFAPTANMNVVNTPTGNWTTFTWASAGSIDLVDSSSNQLYNTVSSDWMTSADISSVARNDGGTLPMFMFRIHLPTGAGAYTYTTESSVANTTSTSTSYDTEALTYGRRWYKIFQSNIDSVATPASFTQTAESSLVPACILQFKSRGRVISFMCAGDSIMGGSLSTSNMLSPGFRAAASKSLSSIGSAVQYIGSGWASQTSANYLANAKTIISLTNPAICAYSVYSPNDPTLTATVAATQLRQANEFIFFCRANRCIPILVTPTPDSTDSITISNLKIDLTRTILAMQNQGVLVADFWGSVAAFPGTNTSTGWGWITGTNGDTKHPNDNGAALMANALVFPLNKILNCNFAK